MRLFLLISSAAAGLAVLAWTVARASFASQSGRLWRAILATPTSPVRVDLPETLRAFALRGLAGDDPARAITLTQSADFRQKHRGPLAPLPARQAIAAGAPGFVWQAERRMGPVPVIAVVDSHVNGRGWLGARLLGAIPVADFEGPDADQAQAMRYLAELPWCPDAILTNSALTWTMEGADRVSVSMDTPGGPARVIFGLDRDGDIVSMTARSRPAETGPDGAPVLRDWQGQFSDYAMVGPRRIPLTGEVGYLYEDGYEAYWIGRITALHTHS